MYYIVKIRAHQRMLSTIAAVFEEDRKASDVVLLSVEPEPGPVAPARKSRYENGARDKGISARDLLLSLVPTPGSVVAPGSSPRHSFGKGSTRTRSRRRRRT